MKKRAKFLGVVASALMIVLAVLFIYACNGIPASNHEKINEAASSYVIKIYDADEIIACDNVIVNEELEVLAVLVKYKVDDKEEAACVYFTKNKVNNKHYEISGSVGCERGEVLADSQEINGRIIVFIRGVDLQEGTTFTIDELGYEGTVQTDSFLDLYTFDPSQYDVKIKE